MTPSLPEPPRWTTKGPLALLCAGGPFSIKKRFKTSFFIIFVIYLSSIPAPYGLVGKGVMPLLREDST
jgi:hypothetical protein